MSDTGPICNRCNSQSQAVFVTGGCQICTDPHSGLRWYERVTQLESENRDLIQEKHPRYKAEDWMLLLDAEKLIREMKDEQISELEATISRMAQELGTHPQKESCTCGNRNCVDCYTDDLAGLNQGIEVDDE